MVEILKESETISKIEKYYNLKTFSKLLSHISFSNSNQNALLLPKTKPTKMFSKKKDGIARNRSDTDELGLDFSDLDEVCYDIYLCFSQFSIL